MAKTVSQLFQEPPSQWGLRGDPYLWGEMAVALQREPLPTSITQLRAILEATFEKLVGAPITATQDPYVERFAHGGMSSGFVNMKFWNEEAFPLLLQRATRLGTISDAGIAIAPGRQSMGIPDFQSFMLPALQELQDGQEHRRPDLIDRVAVRLNLSEADKAERLPSGKHLRYAHRCSWALFDLLKAGFVERPKRGVFRITDAGRTALKQAPARISRAFLDQYSPQYRLWRAASPESEPAGNEAETGTGQPASERTPYEQLEGAFGALKATVQAELLSRLLASTPAFLERIVVDLLVAMGYGGSRADAGEALGRSGDGGVDGIVKEDKLGLDVVYVQAKRWDPARTVGRPDIQQFAGSLAGLRARKGVFITTSSFSRDAMDYVTRIDAKVVLIDGAKLTELLFEHDIGVRIKDTYHAKEIDEDAFEEEP